MKTWALGAGINPAKDDWKVQTNHNTKVSIFVPLASRIPFAQIEIPKLLKVEASPEVQGLANDFLRLRDAEQ